MLQVGGRGVGYESFSGFVSERLVSSSTVDWRREALMRISGGELEAEL